MSTLVDLEGKQLQWGIGFDSPLFVSSFLLTSVMLRVNLFHKNQYK